MIAIRDLNPAHLASLVLALLALCGCVAALVNAKKWTLIRSFPSFFTVLLGVLAIESGGMLGYALLVVSIPVAWRAAKTATDPDSAETQRLYRRAKGVALVIVSVAVIGLAFYRLDNYTRMALTWESPVIEDLITELESDRPVSESFTNRLRWNHGVLSGGASSMVFGFPALLGLKFIAVNFWALRLPAAVAFVGACIGIFMVAQRTQGFVVAVSALAFFGLNQVVLIYARYGSSAAGSLCALLFALLVCVRLLQTQRIALAPLAAGCLYMTTLGYAPARVPVLVLVFMTPLGILLCREFSIRRRVASSTAFLLAIASILLFQAHAHATHLYFAARGEQFFGMLVSKYWPDEIRALQTVSSASKPLTPGELIGVAIELVRQVTWPQLWSLLDPIGPELRRAGDALLPPFHDDPPFLKIQAALIAPFFILGVCACVRARQYWYFSTLILWLLGTFGSVLLSNRVDDHRLLFATIPFSLFAALGVQLVVRAWTLANAPRLPMLVAIAALFWFGVWPRTTDMYDPPGTASASLSALREVISDLPPKNVVLVTDIFHRELAVLRLELWRDRARSGKQLRGLAPDLREAIDRGTALYRPNVVRQLVDLVKQGSTIILHPATRYLQTASLISKEGAFVYSKSYGTRQFLVIDAGRDLPSTKFQLASLPQISEVAKVPLVLPVASGVPLSSLVPIKQSYGFSEMRVNRTWGGSSILIEGEPHESGVGLHAPTTLRYVVPPGASAFQTIVAIDDDAQACARGSVRFTARDQKNKVLHQSAIITHGAAQVVVVGTQGVSELELEVDDAGDGRDCDHVDLVDALFVVPPVGGAACVCPKPTCGQ